MSTYKLRTYRLYPASVPSNSLTVVESLSHYQTSCTLMKFAEKKKTAVTQTTACNLWRTIAPPKHTFWDKTTNEERLLYSSVLKCKKLHKTGVTVKTVMSVL